MRVIVSGAAGHMGRALTELLLGEYMGATIAAAVDVNPIKDPPSPAFTSYDACDVEADCIIDFSNHAGTSALLTFARRRALPVVIATTGHTESEREEIVAASKEIPIFFSANMSVGIAVLAKIAAEAAKVFPCADIEIVECHHNRKLDVPSGTALMLADAIREVRPDSTVLVGRHENGKRPAGEIGIHSLRMGGVVGDHEIIISTPTQTLHLRHEAHSRALFAEGAVNAADFLVGKAAGLYTMKDLVKGDTVAI